MNELLVSTFLKHTIKSINDLNIEEFKNYKKNFTKKYKRSLSIFSYFEKMDFTTNSILYRNLRGIREVYSEKMIFSHTRVKTGSKMIMIPLEVETEMEIIFSKDLNERGLFRRSASIIDVKECSEMLKSELEKDLNGPKAAKKLKKYDIITHTVVFKNLFDNYDPIFPNRFRSQLKKISKIENSSEKLILVKFCMLALPDSNRFFLDSVCKFFYCIQFIVSDKGTDYSENMDMNGFAAVMGPKLFLKNGNIKDMEEISNLIGILGFIFKNYNEIFKVEDIL